MFHEYPSIIGSSRGPKDHCFAYAKLDGSNLRFKYTQKKGFCMAGTRTQSLDASHPHLGEGVALFKRDFEPILMDIIQKEFSDERELTV